MQTTQQDTNDTNAGTHANKNITENRTHMNTAHFPQKKTKHIKTLSGLASVFRIMKHNIFALTLSAIIGTCLPHVKGTIANLPTYFA